MRAVTVEVFTFDELDDSAKERAREWFRRHDTFDPADMLDGWVTAAAKMLGVTFNAPRGHRTGLAVYWDTNPIGAAFEGSWHAGNMAPDPGAVAAEFQTATELHAVAAQLHAVRAAFPDASADCDAGRNCTQKVDCAPGDAADGSDADENEACDAIRAALEDFAHWIAGAIYAEMEWCESDECVDESITANEYEFTEDGERHV